MDYNKNDKYETLISELNLLHETNPERANILAKQFLIKMGKEPNNDEVLKTNRMNFNIICLILIFIMMAIVGLVNTTSEYFFMYIFGEIFFIAGLMVGLNVKYFGLIFLFSHGGTGLGIMLYNSVINILDNPLFNDGGSNLYTYLGIAFFIMIIAVGYTLIYNISDSVKTKSHSILVSPSLFLIAISMIKLFDLVANYIYAL